MKAGSGPDRWWQFAIRSVLQKIRQKRNQWKWETIKTRFEAFPDFFDLLFHRSQNRDAYVQLYKDRKLGKKQGSDQVKQIGVLESVLSFEDIL